MIVGGTPMTTFVLVSGAWLGGWAWQGVAPALRAAGHTVYTPTLTGLGERVHLARPEVDLDTHIEDVANLLRFEDLRDVVLLGHSYAGIVVTGVADRMPDRVAEVVLLETPSAPPADVQPRDLAQGLFRPGPDDLLVTLALRPSAAWVADYHPCESITESPDGSLVVRLRARDTAWVRRLVLRLGDAGRVVAPESVAQAVRDDAALALAAYAP